MSPTCVHPPSVKFFLGALLALAGAASALAYSYIDSPSVAVWQPGTISIQIKLGTATTLSDGTNHSTSVQTAMTTWNNYLGVVQFSAQVVAAGTSDSSNNINEIVFATKVEGQDFGAGVLAVTLSSTYPSIHERVESDILFNTNAITWDSYRGPQTSNGAKDIRRVALHELGHVLGLDHPDDHGQTVVAIMNKAVSDIDALTADDIAGAQSLYRAPGPTTPASNDNFSGATSIVLVNNAAQLAGTTIYGTKENGEPNHAGYPGGKSGWWKWAATGAGTMTITLNGSQFDTIMGVYTGASVGALSTVASNDDTTAGSLSYSTVTFATTAGTTYWIGVDGFGAQSGVVALTVSFSPVASNSVPTITSHPASTSASVGASVQFSVAATGTPAPAYQWQRLAVGSGAWVNLANGGSYSGVNGATLTVSSLTTAMNGDQFRCIATNIAGSATSGQAMLTVNTATPVNVGHLINLSVRTNAGTDAQTLIVGLVVGGSGTSGNKPLLLRGAGPTLTSFGVPGALADPIVELYSQPGSVLITTNNNWGGDAQVAGVGSAVGAFPFASSTSLDAALYTTPAGGVYSVKVLGAASTTGIALAEIYDATAAGTFGATTPRLINVSARTQVGTDANILIAGFVIGGTTPCTVMIRGVGPTLGNYGVPGVLANPQLTLFQTNNGVNTQVGYNDDWGQAANAGVVATTSTQVGAFDLASGSKDAVILITLQPGVYSAQVSGVGNTTGVALVEIYEVP
ncbi:MAG: hypothetical protein JWM88_1685 [Verrucomicrobia bacterium]|nr:hypothetical protein [Verrucomicrobiota bacterium]